MITVTEAFKAAVEASPRRWRSRVLVQLAGAELQPPTYQGDAQDSVVGVDQVGDGETSPSAKFAFAGDRCLPEDDLYPVDASYHCGYWGEQQADYEGRLKQHVVFVYPDDSIPRIKQLKMYFDEWLGYATGFEIWYKPLGGLYALLQEVTDNDQLTWEYEHDTPIEPKELWFTFTAISNPYEFVRVMEIEAGWIEDMSDRLVDWSCRKERYFVDADPLLPNASANSADLCFNNSDGALYQKNSDSIYYGCLKANQKVWLYVSLYVNGAWEEIPIGVFYTCSWASKRGDLLTSVKTLDRAKRLMESTYSVSQVLFNKKISEVAEEVLQDAGLDPDEYVIDDTGADSVIPFVWFEPVSHWYALSMLAAAEGGRVYVDEYDRVIFENREHLTSGSSVATLAYDKHFGDVNDDWDEDWMRNYIMVKSNPYQVRPPEQEEIWTLPAAITVPVGSYRDIAVVFATGECVDVRPPQLGNSADYTTAKWQVGPTATGGTIRLTNNSGWYDDVINTGDVYVIGKPVRTQIWASGEILTVPAGGTLDLEVFFDSVPAIDIQAPQITAVNTTAAWVSGPYAFGGKIRLTNGGAAEEIIDTGNITVRGKPLEQIGVIDIRKQDSSSIARNGKRDFTYESPFLQSSALAMALAEFWLEQYRDPSGPISLDMEVRGMPHLQLADKVTVSDPVKLKISGDYWITGIELKYNGGLDGILELLPGGG